MANQEDLKAQIALVEASQQQVVDSVSSYITEVGLAVDRLLAKIASVSVVPELQPEIDRLVALVSKDSETKTKLDTASTTIKAV